MKVSLNILKDLVGFELPPVDELVEKINMQLGGVEEIIDLREKYSGAVVVKVVECVDHPDSDHMHVCMVDDGGVVKDVERNEAGLVQVVCGAPNARSGMWAVWLPPRTTVPSSFDESELFVLGSRELRGVMSNGMLASPKELALGDDHDGILELTETDLPPESSVALEPGLSFAELFGLDDIILDIENKMFTHRPDCFGQIGVAREVFAILQKDVRDDAYSETRFKEFEWYWMVPQFTNADKLDLQVINQAGEKSKRFMAVAMSGVEVRQSPVWMRAVLVRLGSKPLNNIVDLTNYMMLMTAQPVHAYDYDKLAGQTLGVRMAKSGEQIRLLNDKIYQLDEDDIVIVDGNGPVGLAGIMGGGDSEISADTKNIVYEVANFDMYAVRKSSMRHGLFTDALTRFNKGQSYLQTDRVLHRLMDLTPAVQASNVFGQVGEGGELHEVAIHPALSIRPSFINERLGLSLTGYEIGNILRLVNFATYPEVENDPDSELNITAPFWRTDIVDKEDIVEEVGRLYGFENLPVKLPVRAIVPASKNPKIAMKQTIRQKLLRLGANEVLTYSFVHEKTLKGASQDSNRAYMLGNALSPDLQYYRLSIVPSLLDKVHMNIKSGHDEFALYEFGKGHVKGELADDGLPKEFTRLGLVYASKKPKSGEAFYRAKKFLTDLGRDLTFVPIEDYEYDSVAFGQVLAPFAPGRAAVVFMGESLVGVVGEFKASVRRNFKLPDYTAGFEVFQSFLLKLATPAYHQLSRFPNISQDISLKVDHETSFKDVFRAAELGLVGHKDAGVNFELSTVGIYQAEALGSKTVTLRLKSYSDSRTLTDEEAKQFVASIAKSAAQSVSAEVE